MFISFCLCKLGSINSSLCLWIRQDMESPLSLPQCQDLESSLLAEGIEVDQQLSVNDAQLESMRTQSIAIHVSRKTWFDHMNTLERNVSWNLVGVKTIGFEAVPASMDIVEKYIPNLKCELPVIYLCHFHPCIDPPICELVDQVKTNKWSVCLVIILPVFELLMDHLRGNEAGCAHRGEHAASKIFTPVDVRSWLGRWRYNIVPEWKIVIQYQNYAIVMNDHFFYIC